MKIIKSKEIYFYCGRSENIDNYKNGDYVPDYRNFLTAKDLMYTQNHSTYNTHIYVFEATIYKYLSLIEKDGVHRAHFKHHEKIVTDFRLIMALPIDVLNTWNILFEDFGVVYTIWYADTQEYTMYRIAIDRDNVSLMKHFLEITSKPLSSHLLIYALNSNKMKCFDFMIGAYDWCSGDNELNQQILLQYINEYTKPHNYNKHIINKMSAEVKNKTDWYKVVKKCIKKGNSKLAAYIINRFNLDVNKEGAELLETAVKYNYIRCVKLIVKKDYLIGNIDELRKLNCLLGNKCNYKKALEKRSKIFGYLQAVKLVGKSAA